MLLNDVKEYGQKAVDILERVVQRCGGDAEHFRFPHVTLKNNLDFKLKWKSTSHVFIRSQSFRLQLTLSLYFESSKFKKIQIFLGH